MALRLINRPLLASLSPVALQAAKANVPAVSVAFSRLYPAARPLSQVAKREDEPAGHVAYKDPFEHPFFTKGFDEFFSTPFFRNRDSPFDLMPVFPNMPRGAASMLRVSSPGFEIHEDDDKFSIAIDVPEVRAEDMEIRLENDGRVLHLSGGRMIDEGEEVRETRFDKRFSIGESVDTDNIKANLHEGVLTVIAPKKEVVKKELPKIAITEGPMNE
jgi:HSP20 family protein